MDKDFSFSSYLQKWVGLNLYALFKKTIFFKWNYVIFTFCKYEMCFGYSFWNTLKMCRKIEEAIPLKSQYTFSDCNGHEGKAWLTIFILLEKSLPMFCFHPCFTRQVVASLLGFPFWPSKSLSNQSMYFWFSFWLKLGTSCLLWCWSIPQNLKVTKYKLCQC